MTRLPVWRTPAGFELDGVTYRVTDWTPVLSQLPYAGRWHLRFLADALAPADAEVLTARLLDPADPLDLPDIEQIVHQLVGAATGWPWYAARKLAGAALVDWPTVHGMLLYRGVDLAELVVARPAAALNAVYYLLARYADERRRVQLDADLDAPPPGAEPEAPEGWSAEEEGALFMAALADA